MNKPFRCSVSPDLFRRAAMCISHEMTRYYLGGVHVEPHPHGGALLVATDGARLICIRDPDGYVEGSAIVSLTKGMLKTAENPRSHMPIHMNCTDFSLVVEGDRAAIGIWKTSDEATIDDAWTLPRDPGRLVAGFQWNGVLIDGTFPDWRRVITGSPDMTKPVSAFNVDVIASIVHALCTYKHQRHYQIFPMLTAEGQDIGHAPHVILPPPGNGIDGFGIVMPVNAKASKGLPDWWESVRGAVLPADVGKGKKAKAAVRKEVSDAA